ncbi:hypothetical protein [Serratia phage X20]|uniref:Transmembrane protein n=1 Tax=Serratia phage X20 TaxID=2006942 RepID=A0A1Z1LZJ6_9CAUD|nr:hypothetical protein KNT72_gp145 [Serratia phage X20]ARW58243.1 hypothetical protein [Serratia phage X20]QYN80711.1 hypothetical protein [Kosakonia phage Kc304]UJJ22266.1 hypothetical protein [Erwinia phage Virsaitis27]UYM28920.1 hypothetical protein [Serratia phage vB_SspM_LC53]
MREFFAMAYLFVLGIVTVAGAFLFLGAPLNEEVALIPFIGVFVLAFERLCVLCGVIK